MTARAVKPGDLKSWRRAKRRSVSMAATSCRCGEPCNWIQILFRGGSACSVRAMKGGVME